MRVGAHRADKVHLASQQSGGKRLVRTFATWGYLPAAGEKGFTGGRVPGRTDGQVCVD
ncbi:hypothetical protein GCM10027157_15370 [Corynebacterium aquatimens]